MSPTSAVSSRPAGDKDADANAAKLVEIYPALPANITAADTYEIVQHFIPWPVRVVQPWAAWAMKHLYQYGLGYPKGNTNWGKDAADPRNAIYEGRPDPVAPGYTGNAIARCLAGTGPTSWSLNGKESGVYDLVGNAWEWVDMLIGTTANHTIDAEYPGAGSRAADRKRQHRDTPTPQRRTATGPSRQTRSLRQRLALQKQSMTMITTGRQPVSVLRDGAGIGTVARAMDCSA